MAHHGPWLLPSRFPWSNYLSAAESALALASLLPTTDEGHFAEMGACHTVDGCEILHHLGLLKPLFSTVARFLNHPLYGIT